MEYDGWTLASFLQKTRHAKKKKMPESPKSGSPAKSPATLPPKSGSQKTKSPAKSPKKSGSQKTKSPAKSPKKSGSPKSKSPSKSPKKVTKDKVALKVTQKVKITQ
jgi:hypothetical protein